MASLANCGNLQEIRDFEWSKTLLAPNTWAEKPTDGTCQQGLVTSVFREGLLDLHGTGFGEKASIVVLAGLLPRISDRLMELDLRYP